MRLWLFICSFSSTFFSYTVSHSHFFFTTITNTNITNNFTSSYPDYYVTRSIDDITLLRYDSVNEVIERRVPWFKSTYSTLLFDSINQLRMQESLQNILQIVMNHLNDTEGFHVLQVLQGCVLYENFSNDTIFSYHYDGEPFLTFNVEEATWIPEDPKVQDFADILNMNDTVTHDTKNVLVHECIPHISKLLSLGKCTFNRREQPVVAVTQMPIQNTIYRLLCRAYGHYPKDISMMWYKNGEPVSESLMDRVTLPFPDITYLTQLSMNITLLDNEVYTCIVTHSSMMSPLTARLSGDSSDLSNNNNDNNVGGSGISIGGIIGISLATTVLVVSVVFGSVWWAKNKVYM
ncbi:major histocompatibility complex class I-related protein 1-like [Lithobates pipiens]